MNTPKNPLHKPCIIIFGPTAVGKSALAEQLGTVVPIEIINMDMGQLYTPLTIGTAKPVWQKSPIPHHMFDVIDEPRNYTVMEYNARVIPLIQEIQERGSIPVLVGGSAFYLKSLLFPVIEQEVVAVPAHGSHTGTWDELNAIDPERASHIHPHDTYRINRALHIWYTTGNKPSTLVPCFNPPADFMLIMVTRDRTQLYDRINTRVEQMVDEGWLAECVHLLGTPWESFIESKGIIGYREMMAVAAKRSTMEKAISLIAQQTRNYAKRQHTFWRMLHKKITGSTSDKRFVFEEANLTLLDLDLYISQLSDRIHSFYIK
ncbi:MAG: tRNA (adenosine(37)-N6)-dimethylallyltransferase MiaA [Candidatus Babeliales bacterium]